MKATEIAAAHFDKGYSCSQAVFAALSGKWDVPPELAVRVAAGFGGGIARTAGVCGCVTGAIMALGLAQPPAAPDGIRAAKEKAYETCRQFLRAFEQRHNSTLCRDLLGCDISTPEGTEQSRREDLHHKVCQNLVRDAVEIVESMVESGAA